MATLKELLEQQRALQAQIDEVKKVEIAQAVAQARQIVADYNLTAEDIFTAPKSKGGSSTKGKSVAPKYRDPATGNTWTGRGKAPAWIAGVDRNQFLISA